METVCVHGAGLEESPQPAVSFPIYQAATFRSPADGGAAEARSTLSYSRYSNPTVWRLERLLARLEGAASAAAAASGLAAISNALLALSRPGDHIVAALNGYGSTTAVLRQMAADGARDIGLARDSEVESIRAALQPGTKLVLVESLGNPLNDVADLPALAAAAHDQGALLLVDATFASPVLQRPLELGADLVLHSASKYLNGHSDLIAGVVAGPAALVDPVWERMRLSGPCLDPHAAWLLQRGLKTLHLRMERICANALRLAGHLEAHTAVQRVFYPGLPSHPHHERARRLLPRGCGGIVSFTLRGGDDAAQRFCRALQLVLDATSLGGVESLVSMPSRTSHAGLSPSERRAAGIEPGTVRLAVGVEAAADLEADLDAALEAAC